MDAIHLPPGLTLPSALGAPAAPLQAGQVIQALVLELIEGDIFRLQIPQATIDVRSSVPLTPGNTITLAAKGSGAGTRLAIYTDVPAGPAASGPAAAPSLAGRTPIGEAVVISRAATAQRTVTAPTPPLDGKATAPLTARVSAEAATLDEPTTSTPLPAPRQAETVLRLVTPEQAVTEAIQTAAPRQAGLSPLFADLAQILQAGDAAHSAIPAPVKAAAADVLSFRTPLDEQLSAADLKQAFVRSGILFEPRLAASGAPPRTADSVKAPDDLKAALLVLRQVLKAWTAAGLAVAHDADGARPDATRLQAAVPWVGAPTMQEVHSVRDIASALDGLAEQSNSDILSLPQLSAEAATGLAKSVASALMARDGLPTRPPSAGDGVPPPWRGAPLAAQAPVVPSIAPDASPREIADKLIGETDRALARQTLLQVASLPEQPERPQAEATQRWNFEVPFATPQGTAIAQFDVTRDESEPHARTWRARFSIDVEPMGPVHAMIALSGARTSVTLWAERVTTATRLNENAPRLSEALRAAELEPADFQARVGRPPAARQAMPGRFMDRAS